MVNYPKTKRTHCKGCNAHTQHGVTYQKKAGKASLVAQGKRRYDNKQKGFGGQTKPVFKKNAKTTKKAVLKLKCKDCEQCHQVVVKRCKVFTVGQPKKSER
mmetsp:Transcript_99160/g.241117  ORF Transcript_99160/g.241117 Transcript_99160/m.241117 type:complete len:101 (-) Transcript_99160:9-311(-)